MPALATSRSTSRTWATMRSTEPRSQTSTCTHSPPISAATACTCPPLRAPTTTSQPSPASARAIPAPIPRPPPVTSALIAGTLAPDPATTDTSTPPPRPAHPRHPSPNLVSPGAIDTPSLRSALAGAAGDGHVEARVAEMGAGNPIGRLGTPRDVGKSVVFLFSDDSSFVTGIELLGDCGMAQTG